MDASDDIDTIRFMKIKDLKSELDAAQIPHADVFEKEELVRRVFNLRTTGPGDNREPENTTAQPSESAITVPLYILSNQDRELKLANDTTMSVSRDQDAQFCAVQVKIPQDNSKQEHTLVLLVDTACSGVVLRSSVPSRCGLPLYNSPSSTMTGASGVASGLGQISQISRFYLTNRQELESRRQFGPLPAAIQDISALPFELDGILGLSFLSQFAAIDFNFGSSALILHSETPPVERLRTPLTMIGSYGIYGVDVLIDGRGPVRLLLDTGASNSLINSEGVRGLGLDIAALEKLPQSTGAIGVDDGLAMTITHRIFVKDAFLLGKNGENRLKVVYEFELSVAEIPILDGMSGIVGILGIDALKLCQNLRISCKHPAFVSVF